MAYEAKTKPTAVSVDDFLDAITDPQRRADARAVSALMQDVTGEAPTLWGSSIVGFGRYRYTYASGHSGEAARIGFSPRKANLVLYLMGAVTGQEALLARLGKHKTGKGCLYLNRLADVDQGILRELIGLSAAYVNSKHGPGY